MPKSNPLIPFILPVIALLFIFGYYLLAGGGVPPILPPILDSGQLVTCTYQLDNVAGARIFIEQAACTVEYEACTKLPGMWELSVGNPLTDKGRVYISVEGQRSKGMDFEIYETESENFQDVLCYDGEWSTVAGLPFKNVQITVIDENGNQITTETVRRVK